MLCSFCPLRLCPNVPSQGGLPRTPSLILRAARPQPHPLAGACSASPPRTQHLPRLTQPSPPTKGQAPQGPASLSVTVPRPVPGTLWMLSKYTGSELTHDPALGTQLVRCGAGSAARVLNRWRAAGMLGWHPSQGSGHGQCPVPLTRRAPGSRLLVLSESHTTMQALTSPPSPVYREWGLAQLEPLPAIGKLDKGVLFRCKSDEVTTLLKTLRSSLLSSRRSLDPLCSLLGTLHRGSPGLLGVSPPTIPHLELHNLATLASSHLCANAPWLDPPMGPLRLAQTPPEPSRTPLPSFLGWCGCPPVFTLSLIIYLLSHHRVITCLCLSDESFMRPWPGYPGHSTVPGSQQMPSSLQMHEYPLHKQACWAESALAGESYEHIVCKCVH